MKELIELIIKNWITFILMMNDTSDDSYKDLYCKNDVLS